MSKSWLASKTVWIAILQAIGGVLIVVYTENPTFGWAMLSKSVVDVFIRALTTEPLK